MIVLNSPCPDPACSQDGQYLGTYVTDTSVCLVKVHTRGPLEKRLSLGYRQAELSLQGIYTTGGQAPLVSPKHQGFLRAHLFRESPH